MLAAVLMAGLALQRAAWAQTESEPNDVLGQANALAPNDTVTAAIGSAGDQDWYKVTVSAQGRLQLSLLGPPANMRGQMELYNRNADWMGVFAVAINDTVSKQVVVRGPVTVTLGTEPKLGPCPICLVPGMLRR